MKYKNPILRGFHPDPSICRVGGDYYLVTSSFEYFPGIPVYHSKDLVNWEHIGNCIERENQLPLKEAKSSGGVWAPTIRFHEGTFYVTATFDGRGNFIISSKTPETGWSDVVWTNFDGIDPSLFFEDGKMYYCTNDIGARYKKYGCEGISLVQMDPESGVCIGEDTRIWNGAGGGWLEAPHIYHIGAYYYLIAAEGGTGSGHHEVAARSKNLWGPYENCSKNPILTNRNDCSKRISCSGHGDLVDDPDGNWWMVHLGTRDYQGMTFLGRETFLMPVRWEEDWPFVGEDRKARIDVEAPLWAGQKIRESRSVSLDCRELTKNWLFRRIPDWKLFGNDEEGNLTIQPSSVKLSDAKGASAFMALRQPDDKYCVKLKFAFDPAEDGDSAGVVIYLNENYYCRLFMKKENGQSFMIFERRMDGVTFETFRRKAESGKVTVQLKCDGEKYEISYKENSGEEVTRREYDNGEKTELPSLNQGNGEKKEFRIGKEAEQEYILAGTSSVKYLSTTLAGKCFTGALLGLFAECNEKTTAKMRVSEFQWELNE